jgi:hypothetical protein
MADNVKIAVNGQRVAVTTNEGDALRQAKAAAGNNPLDGLTLKQALDHIDAEVKDLASARTALKNLARLIFVMRAESERGQKRR